VRKNSISAFKIILILFLSLKFTPSFSQNAKEIATIVKSYDLKKLQQLQKYYENQSRIQKQQALKAAKLNNWPEFIKNENGSVDELMKLTSDGKPLYYSVNNKDAAKSTRTNFLNSGGGLGLTLDGQNMTARVWDAGKVRTTHQEFGGRVTVNDNIAGPTGNHFHATHVTGTIAAAGVVANAKGMAPLAQVRTFDWTNDVSEAISEVQQGMLLSNHSYGVPIVNNGVFVPSWYIGAYTEESKAWDEVAYNAPYYLMVASAGNNGDDSNPNPSTGNYDKLTGNKTSKNNLVVANTNDANIASNGNLTSVSINSSSSEGPSDDRRIKPDISGNGTGLYSSLETSDVAYGSLTGTSMAAPNVTGTLLLLQQHYKNINFRFMKAATLKALACHTADDTGRVGPDAIFGWGLLNAKKAAETITTDGLGTLISEEILQQGQTFTMTVNSNGTEPLQASIAWTDAPGTPNNGILNDPTPALVNDLDIRITKNENTYYPWRLQSNATQLALNNGDNSVDNLEKINVPSATGTYTITVTHKGTLKFGTQNFSLIITGITSGFALTSTSEDKIVCNTETASYTFNHIQSSAGTTNLSVIDMPANANVSLSTSSLSAAGSVTMNITNLQNVAPGDYRVGLKGVRGSETEIKYVNLKVYSNNFQNIAQTSPVNAKNGVSTSVKMTWNSDVNAESYRIQVATDNSFNNIVINTTSVENEYIATNLDQAARYYWRVFPINRCAEGTSAAIRNFETGTLTCGQAFVAQDFSQAFIDDTSSNAEAIVPITVTGGLTVGQITASVNISHTYLGDIVVYLQGPEEIGSPMIKLFDQPCGESEDIDVSLSDMGSVLTCANFIPAISGTVAPNQPLSNFNNLPADGIWNLYVFDGYNGDGGSINSFSLSFCNVAVANLSVNQNKALQVSVYPNPTKGIININLADANSDKTILNLYDIQGRKILSKESHNSQETLNIENLSDGIYMLSIESGNLKTTKKVILSR